MKATMLAILMALTLNAAAVDAVSGEDVTAALLRADKAVRPYPGESGASIRLRFNRAFAIKMKKWTAADEKDHLVQLREIERTDAEARRLEDQRAKAEAWRLMLELMMRKPSASAMPSSRNLGTGSIRGA